MVVWVILCLHLYQSGFQFHWICISKPDWLLWHCFLDWRKSQTVITSPVISMNWYKINAWKINLNIKPKNHLVFFSRWQPCLIKTMWARWSGESENCSGDFTTVKQYLYVWETIFGLVNIWLGEYLVWNIYSFSARSISVQRALVSPFSNRQQIFLQLQLRWGTHFKMKICPWIHEKVSFFLSNLPSLSNSIETLFCYNPLISFSGL